MGRKTKLAAAGAVVARPSGLRRLGAILLVLLLIGGLLLGALVGVGLWLASKAPERATVLPCEVAVAYSPSDLPLIPSPDRRDRRARA